LTKSALRRRQEEPLIAKKRRRRSTPEIGTAFSPPSTRNRAADPVPVFTRCGTPDNLNEIDVSRSVSELLTILEKATEVAAWDCKLKPADIEAITYTLIVHETRRERVLTEDHLRLLEAALHFRSLSAAARAFLGLPPVRDDELLEVYLQCAAWDAEKPMSARELQRKLAAEYNIKVDEGTIRRWRKQLGYRSRVRFIQGSRCAE
jgi:hypothetical protein